MPADDPALAELIARIGAFRIADPAMRRAQRAIEAAVAAGNADERARRSYFDAARRYFGHFDREARAHLRDVDRRLERINQIAFNLAAERGVAVKRIEGTTAVLKALEPPPP